MQQGKRKSNSLLQRCKRGVSVWLVFAMLLSPIESFAAMESGVQAAVTGNGSVVPNATVGTVKTELTSSKDKKKSDSEDSTTQDSDIAELDYQIKSRILASTNNAWYNWINDIYCSGSC